MRERGEEGRGKTPGGRLRTDTRVRKCSAEPLHEDASCEHVSAAFIKRWRCGGGEGLFAESRYIARVDIITLLCKDFCEHRARMFVSKKLEFST